MNNVSKVTYLVSMVLIVCFCKVIVAGDAERVQSLLDIIRKGPSLYRTEEANAAFLRANPNAAFSSVTGAEGLDAIKQSIRAAINLGDMGEIARDAIPVLIEKFLVAEDLVAIKDARFGPGVGSFEDWVQTDVVSTKNKYIFSSPFVEYQTLTRCEKWVEASATTNVRQDRRVGKKVVEAVVDIYITVRINAAACALARITGFEGGTSREAWKQWYENNRGIRSANSSQEAIAPTANTSASVNTLSSPSIPRNVVSYTSLFDGSYVGKPIEVALKNGSVFKGLLAAVDSSSLQLTMDNTKIPLMRSVIDHVAIVEDIPLEKKVDAAVSQKDSSVSDVKPVTVPGSSSSEPSPW